MCQLVANMSLEALQMREQLNACHQSVPLFVTKCPHARQQVSPKSKVATYSSGSAFLIQTEVTKLGKKNSSVFKVHCLLFHSLKFRSVNESILNYPTVHKEWSSFRGRDYLPSPPAPVEGKTNLLATTKHC